MGGFGIRATAGVLSWLVLASSALADVGAFISEVVAAHGGGAAPTAIHEVGVTQSQRRGAGPVERWWQSPDRFRIDIRYPGAEETRLLRGADAWQQGQPATAPFHGALVLQAARMALPWRLRENAGRVVDLGSLDSAAGRPVRVLEWAVQEGVKLIVDIDPATRLVMRSRGILTINNASMEFATRYGDYRPVAGRLVAFVEQHFAMGQFIGTTTLQAIEFPDVLPDKVFSAPQSGLVLNR